MKLIKLTMTAFGPYKDKQVIDFTQLKDRRLFVISGATGAGKTTIFDAITFALYGQASGSDRDNVLMLRSHFACVDVHTSVELIFQLHNRIYRVFRQMGHIKPGNKTRTGERYEFFEITEDGEIPAVDRQIVSEINKKIESLIGLTAEQFKQIVMLPQGEFRKLLTSSTENKEDILRRLFQTKRYQLMTELLKEKQNKMQLEYEREQQELERYINSIETSIVEREDSLLFSYINEDYVQVEHVLEELQKELQFYDTKIREGTEIYNRSVAQFDKQQKQIAQAKFINDQFNELDEKRNRLDQLLAEKEKMDENGKRLELAERASKIEPYEYHLKERETEKQNLETSLRETEVKLNEAEKYLTIAKERFLAEEKRINERNELSQQLIELEKYLPIVTTMNEEKEQIDLLQKDLTLTEKRIENLTKEISEKELELKRKKDDFKSNSEKVKLLSDKKHKRSELLNEYYLLEQIIEQYNELTKLKRSIQKYDAQHKIAREELNVIEEKWIEQQAAVLASTLTDGEPCPVCGSTHHPNKQHMKSGIISEQEIRQKRNIEQKLLNHIYELQGKIESIESILEQTKRTVAYEIDSVEQAEQQKAIVFQKGKRIKTEIDELEKLDQSLKNTEKQIEQLESLLDQKKTEKEQLEKQFSFIQIEKTRKEATFQEKIRVIPKEYHKLENLQTKINETTSLVKQLEHAHKEAQEHLKQAETEQTKLNTNVENLKVQLKEVIEKVKAQKEVLEVQLKQANFINFEQYKRAKLSEEERNQLRTTIERYKQNLITLEEQIDELETKLKDKQRNNIEEMEKLALKLKERYEKALEQVNRFKDLKQKAEQLHENILRTYNRVNKLEKRLSIVKDLYDVVRGQNSKKISFERYLLIDYLDQIIYAANNRFKTLSDGQYQLVRSERQESHGRQSGLMIDVYDGFTGQLRDVKTLSGGEKFIASLCLALGMSDIIQSFQGNIEIDTMFIDEGFGSLDEESLHKAIDALIQLQQSGRVIGVISHVEELKRMFPARLEVTKSNEGHSSASFVLR